MVSVVVVEDGDVGAWDVEGVVEAYPLVMVLFVSPRIRFASFFGTSITILSAECGNLW